MMNLSWFSSWERSVLTGLAEGMLIIGGMLDDIGIEVRL